MSKRIISMLFAILLCVSVVGCGDNNGMGKPGKESKLSTETKQDSKDTESTDDGTETENTNGDGTSFGETSKDGTNSTNNSTKNNSGNSNNTTNSNSKGGNNTTPNTSTPTNNSSNPVKPEPLPLAKEPEKPALTEAYVSPKLRNVTFEENASGIYENQYVKLDVTKASKGYISVTYKDPWATKVEINISRGTRFNTQSYKVGGEKTQSFILPFENGSYTIDIYSVIKNTQAFKLCVDISNIKIDGAPDMEYIKPNENARKLVQKSTGVYENKYVRVDTSKASEGYVDVTNLENQAIQISIALQKSSAAGTGARNAFSGLNTSNNVRSTKRVNIPYGSGSYTIYVFSIIEGFDTEKAALQFNVTLKSQVAPFLISAGEVDFNSNTLFVKKAKELCAGLSTDYQKISKIYEWLANYISYYNNPDTASAYGEYYGNLDEIYRNKNGVCYDYAVALTAMLRSQGIACKLVTGYYEMNQSVGHAWVQVYSNASGENKYLKLVEGTWNTLDPTLASTWQNKEDAKDFMLDSRTYIIDSYC